MLKFLKDMFSESPEVSEMRVMALLALIAAAGIAFYGLHLGKDPSNLASLCGAFVGPAFIGKAWQRGREKKTP
jgi:hypothetical protein